MSASGSQGSSKAGGIGNQSPVSVPIISGSEGSQRRGPAGSGARSASKTASPRNNQSHRSQHKRHRRPHLADDDEFAESVAMRSTGSRKGQTSITHLMSFALPPRPENHLSSYPRGRRSANWGARSYHAVDKSRYINANYRFIVDPQKSYPAQATNADVDLDWDSVLQVLAWADIQSDNCPICLSIPVAPRIAKCGHLFCLPCLIRYMHATDDDNPVPEKKARWKKCPICWDSVYMTDARCLGWHTGQQTQTLVEGGDVVLRLISRQPNSAIALPRDAGDLAPYTEDVPWYHVGDVSDYARVMKGGEDYMASQYEAELDALMKQKHEDELLFEDDTTWIQKAISSVKSTKERIQGIGNPPIPSRQQAERRATQVPVQFEASDTATINGETMSNLNLYHSAQDVAGNKNGGKQKETHRSHLPDQPFYFYQALPHYYLSPLDIRILKAAFGEYAQFPAAILSRIEHISTGHVVDEELRKRTKYLNHLPFGCEVAFLECDWTDVVSTDVLDKFRPETERRRKRNKDKAVHEEKERIRAEKLEEKSWVAIRRSKQSAMNELSRPFSDEDFQPLGAEASSSFDASTVSPPWSSRNRNGSSFAELASPSSSPPNRTVWGTAAVAPPSPPPEAEPTPGDDGWLQDWEQELLIQGQEEALSVENKTTPKGKKKKNKKITLMSTSARRAAYS